MQQYPYFTNPIVLTDALFLLYGGQTGTSNQATRNVAYMLAEEQMTEYLHAFLLPTTVTGTYFAPTHVNPIVLDYGYLISVKRVTISSIDGGNSCAIDTVTGCHAVRGDGQYGLIDVQYLLNCGGYSDVVGIPYNVQVAYESGLQSGTTYQPSILQALTLAAQINLNELDVSLSNEGTADVGIRQFTNQKYTELRTRLGTTAFGNSAVAQRIARLVNKYRSKPSIGFH